MSSVISRPAVSIDRLTPRRVTAEPRESMNCKSCRKRKIKCNRMRPSCEACKVFQCPCIYDAVPKKRGPKTDVLEALLKRVDGLEKRLQDENKNPISPTSPSNRTRNLLIRPPRCMPSPAHPPPAPPLPPAPIRTFSTAILLSLAAVASRASLCPAGFHVGCSHQMGQLPAALSMAIYAITLRYTSSPNTPEQSLRMALDYALQARRMVDVDQPTMDGLQALLLLSQTYFAHGLGKKAYMTFTNCASMAIALDLYREPSKSLPAAEREMRRRLFWAVYIMDRFLTCGSKRPGLIADHSIVLRLPAWSPHAAGLNVEGELFNTVGPNIQYSSDPRRKPGATALLIDITRILGITNRYLAAGGVKGDSHFPWHSLSNLSKIRQELDIWATGTQDVFASVEALFGHPESSILLLSKLIYHLVHCLIYRPFLPIDLVELRGTGQHQSWQIEATNLCFSHSNAIAELVELARNSPLIEWPAFVGYCVCTAGTVHVHGVHYKGREGEVFSSSAEFLTREMHQLTWLGSYWAGVQHQREMLQTIYTCHAELVRTLATSPMRFSPVFHLEDFLDRYPGLTADGSHVRLVDMDDIPQLDPYYRPMTAYPMYHNQPPRAPVTLPSNHSPSPRRDSHSTTSTATTKPPGVSSPSLTFHQSQLQSTFTLGNADLTHPSASDATNAMFGFSPPAFLTESLHVAPTPPSHPQYATFPFDSSSSNNNNNNNNNHHQNHTGQTIMTPGAQSQASSSHTAGAGGGSSEAGSLEKDPFLSLLEQLAENEQNSAGGPSELDFFLGGVDVEVGEKE
ncbi:transcription factor domain-containing protein [Aspergillus novofumigatus IBT 16806]|uniref:Putative fungal-specific transcription factor n=1 Tax=Aspergillus novofumigatus (strain IBT 16806) TaxID=1392255 RepID=A0A2I1C6C4_ASPN1|nr:putative fungal-specific transcription factor [Aspergillus novofumigatus IBT 16806]PKX93163.1 putative fungal-specific transcription factor [Aspergillus novofumigatus IBT 16806]